MTEPTARELEGYRDAYADRIRRRPNDDEYTKGYDRGRAEILGVRTPKLLDDTKNHDNRHGED
jgi:hypothetical protein